jgi:hypothetical protein
VVTPLAWFSQVCIDLGGLEVRALCRPTDGFGASWLTIAVAQQSHLPH